MEEEVKNIRTYESDVADLMARKRTSVASIAIAENKKNQNAEVIGQNTEIEPHPHKIRNLLLSLASLILVGAGIAGAYYLYRSSPLSYQSAPTNNAQKQSVIALLEADSKAVLPVDNLNSSGIVSLVRRESEKTQSPGTIKEIIPVLTKNNSQVRITGPEIAKLMGVPAPDILGRSLDAPWFLGVYADPSGQKSIFVIMTNTFFQNSFAGMLQWEKLMPDDLKAYLYSKPPADIANASGTVETMIPNPIVRGQFVDRIVRNKDVREFVTEDNKMLFLYSFIDTDKLVVSGSESALVEVLSRLEKQAFIR